MQGDSRQQMGAVLFAHGTHFKPVPGEFSHALNKILKILKDGNKESVEVDL